MWIVILNFCLFLLLIGFFFYGIKKWSGLISDYEEDGEDDDKTTETLVDGFHYRLPLWILIIGTGAISLAGHIINWLGF